ncbi:MAG: hypothetical protein NT169_10660 [Chloroflexi bacterium]|nr:hypothetical protein [Chloroflexota bacterium]
MKTYTFHITLRGGGRVWRKIEMRSDQTLEDLHYAIQNAYEWDADHMYSFFMSNRAWDDSTEYTLPEDVDPWGDDLDGEDEDEDAEEDIEVEPLDAEEIAQAVQSDEVAAKLAELGLTPDDLQAALAVMADDKLTLEEKLARVSPVMDTLTDFLFETDSAGDVRTTQLEQLDLKVGQKFLYIFDYGDEHQFQLRVHAINPDAPEGDYPRTVESRGQAPAQYPDEEDWDEEMEEDADE